MCECKSKVLDISSPFAENEKSHVLKPKGVTGPKYMQKHYSAVFTQALIYFLSFPFTILLSMWSILVCLWMFAELRTKHKFSAPILQAGETKLERSLSNSLNVQ
ncbi:uncharacterized protein K444DRAFT_212944 [Hyaloscypha bicolor E]|uniref:Uncharacterized protein n=1 Tax=Hyaloscypha bicolor E TaxID=1095630 RepID=A0A2J6TPY8_9HELO|nr:uncharacterized protein K444DRAFT_212944 [Hyaloscypha bicolor E]PMD65084.1 hypothetical protein K444DRAFT_212944 [Hyaloscypha bicolor E]